MEYTVRQLADLAGVTPRTLRYYDRIGLLSPARTTGAGYRIYTGREVDLLQQILFYRELELPLEEIRRIVTDPGFDVETALEHHLVALSDKRARLDALIGSVRRSLSHHKGAEIMDDNAKFEAFKKGLVDENERKYGAEIRERYGGEAVEESNRRLMGLSEEEYARMGQVEAELGEILRQAAGKEDPGEAFGERVYRLHREWLGFSWAAYSAEAHRGLAAMYLADERFAGYYNRMAPGGAQFLHDAILAHCE